MSFQWKPVPAVQKPGQKIPAATATGFIDRFKEMNAQEQLIEQKKREIEQKLLEKKRLERSQSGQNVETSEAVARWVYLLI